MLRKETVLPELMDMLITLQNERTFEQYILAGGTALSLQIGHRKSVDLDFFTNGKLDSENILKYMEINFVTIQPNFSFSSIKTGFSPLKSNVSASDDEIPCFLHVDKYPFIRQ